MNDPRKAILGTLAALDILTNVAQFPTNAGIRDLEDQFANHQQTLDENRLSQIDRDFQIGSRSAAERTTFIWRPDR